MSIVRDEELLKNVKGSRIGRVLRKLGYVTREQVHEALQLQEGAKKGQRVGEILISMGLLDEDKLETALAAQRGLGYVNLDEVELDEAVLARLKPETATAYGVVPIAFDSGANRITIAIKNADNFQAVDDLKQLLGFRVSAVVAKPAKIDAILAARYAGKRSGLDISKVAASAAIASLDTKSDNIDLAVIASAANDNAVVELVQSILMIAIRDKASDVHFEPFEDEFKLRYRIDGVLYEMQAIPKNLATALVSRVKVMSKLDIAERRLPQDGRIRATVLGRKLDLRVSTVPTPKGEKTVMRILDSRSISVGLDDLGFSEDSLTIWKKQIEQPHGIILVTGPTGSGKTTTLYSSIRQMDTRKMNISTVEDPIEYNLNGITQIQTHEKIGMTFAKALKALLRQDPDVVMLGEIRDHETASTAIQAALTGHLVLSTLHTNDAPSSITRMINIGVEPFLVGAALNSVLAQRLVRKVCPKCVAERPVDDDMRDFLITHGIDSPTVRVGTGCPACRQTGYSGRLGLYELLVLDDFLRDKIASNPNVVEFRRLCVERGMVSLREDGFAKVKLGRTTVEEVLSATEATI